MTCDVQELISENPCLYALSPFQLKVVKIQMLCGIKNFLQSAVPVTCDIQEILDEASCFNGLNAFELEVIEAQLLCEILGLL